MFDLYTRKRFASAVLALAVVVGASGCGDDDPTDTPDGGSDAGTDGATDAASDGGNDAGNDAATDAAADGETLPPFSGTCASEQWDDRVSAECWSCLCTTCEMQLNGCGPECLDAINCAIENECLTAAAELLCEGRCVGTACADVPFLGPIFAVPNGPGTALDFCLIGHGDSDAGVLRGCEAECGLEAQPGVCERYPAE